MAKKRLSKNKVKEILCEIYNNATRIEFDSSLATQRDQNLCEIFDGKNKITLSYPDLVRVVEGKLKIDPKFGRSSRCTLVTTDNKFSGIQVTYDN